MPAFASATAAAPPACSPWPPCLLVSLQRHDTLLRTRTVGQSSKVRLRDHVTTVNTGEQRPAGTGVDAARLSVQTDALSLLK